ncbi:MAG: type 4a pilus biogenesis protein PilO [Desulfuromonadales bacterium]
MKLHVVAVSILLVVNIAGMVVVTYQDRNAADLRAKWSDRRRQTVLLGKGDAATLYRQGTADLAKIESRIPRKKEFARVLSDLFEASSESGAAITSISYKPARIKGETLLSYQLTLKVSGSYAAVKSYISDLHKFPEFLIIDKISLANSDLYTENVALDLLLTLYLREGA